MVLRFILICLVVVVLASLFQGLFFLMRAGRDNRAKLVLALSMRIGLSLFLFVLLLLGWRQGWWMPHSIV